jgi:hypothetical protein
MWQDQLADLEKEKHGYAIGAITGTLSNALALSFSGITILT